ncbi:MAG: hypothetical protein KME27_18770 [Lyngbya sp. HA4199-MV5]|jgi:hypothetical protein|nr:hypothetical protein [Lyngbya sp. HA4199-MV5]
MENFLEQIEAIRDDRSIYFPYASDHDIPWISTETLVMLPHTIFSMIGG